MEGPGVSRTRLYLGNLPRDVSRQELEDLFTDYGKIVDTKIMNGFGFVEFEDPMDAKDVVPDFARTAGVDVVYTEVGRYADGTGFVEFETLKDLDIAIEKLDNQEYRGSIVSCTQDVIPAAAPHQATGATTLTQSRDTTLPATMLPGVITANVPQTTIMNEKSAGAHHHLGFIPNRTLHTTMGTVHVGHRLLRGIMTTVIVDGRTLGTGALMMAMNVTVVHIGEIIPMDISR
ncbi:serine arginine-rich splicing factor [Ascosphaera aggregata]|nr:serine arginine-rich splicing factor [Ascosphaera aggregata]